MLSRRQLGILEGRWPSFWLAALVFLGMLPMLASSAQSGDGIEIITTAVRGGVLHPPGFPLQAWLDRIVVALLPVPPAVAISLLCLVAHACSAFLLVETMRVLGLSSGARFLTPLFFLLFPSVWALAVQPEVFALAFCGMCAVTLQCVVLVVESARRSAWQAMLLGVLVGLCGAQHPITVISAPVFLVSAYTLVVDGKTRLGHLAAMTCGFLAVFIGLYASLPLLHSESRWPDWGQLDDARSIVGHLARADYGVGSLSAASVNAEVTSGITVALADLGMHLHVLLLGICGGILVLTKRSRPLAVAFLGMLACAVVFLVQARMSLERVAVLAYLERFEGLLVLPCVLLLGVFFQALPPLRMLPWLLAACVAGMAARGYALADASESDALDVYRQAVASQVSPEAVFMAPDDLLVFGGIPTTEGVRFPIAQGVTTQPWYAEHVLGHVEPRTLPEERVAMPAAELAKRLSARGFSVVTPDDGLVPMPSGQTHAVGLVVTISAAETPYLDGETVLGALRLCPFLARLGPRPPGHHFQQQAYASFAIAFLRAAGFLQFLQRPDAARRFQDQASAILDGSDPSSWNDTCAELTRSMR